MKGHINRFKARKTAALTSALILSLLYGIGSWVIYRNGWFLETIRTNAAAVSNMPQPENLVPWRSGSVCRELAEKTQFYPHSPHVVSELYESALLRAPADHQTFLSYASYLSYRNCCKDKVFHILQEALRRYPKNAKIYQSTASYLFTNGEREKALPYFRKALESEPHWAEQVYQELDRHNADTQTLIAVTPSSGEATLELARYLDAKDPISKKKLGGILQKLAGMDLDPREKLIFAKLALGQGWMELARKQASLASRFEDSRAEAFQLLAQISWQERDLLEFEKYAAEAERTYLLKGDPIKAAECALSTVTLLAGHENSEKIKQRLLKIIEKYPRYAPAYYEAARIYQNDSHELALQHLKKAAELDPAYEIQLAEMYLNDSQPEEAEKIYERMLLAANRQKDAYLGLAKSRQNRGNSLEAIAVLEDGLQKIGKSEELLFQLGRLYDSVGDYSKAAHTYSECTQLNPSRIEAHNLAGDAYMKAGEYLNAREEYRQALLKDPQNTHALDSLSQLKDLGY